MGHRRWMRDDCFGSAEVFSQRAQPHRVHQTDSRFDATFNLKGDEGAAGALLALREFELRKRSQDPGR